MSKWRWAQCIGYSAYDSEHQRIDIPWHCSHFLGPFYWDTRVGMQDFQSIITNVACRFMNILLTRFNNPDCWPCGTKTKQVEILGVQRTSEFENYTEMPPGKIFLHDNQGTFGKPFQKKKKKTIDFSGSQMELLVWQPIGEVKKQQCCFTFTCKVLSF